MGQRLIDNIETNDMNFKHLETTKDIVISPKNEYGDPQRPDATHKWTAKVSDGTNYVGDYAVKISGASMVVDSEGFTKLPVGQYQLEIWEQWIDADGTSELSIYPSPQQTIPFTIYANITDQTATVVQAASDGKNYVTFNIPRGKTGEQGFRGPAGKAFQIKQTFASVKAMEDSQGKDFDDGDFALIASNTQDPDNSKLYVWHSDKKQFIFMSDLSGAQGIQGPAGPAPTLHVTKVTTVPNGGQPSFTATPVGNGNYNIEIGLPKGDKGDTGSRGNNFWAMKMTAGGNVSGRYITDLYSASTSNLPEVNDLVVQPDGNVYQVTGVSNTDDGSNGGGTFNLGSALFSIKGADGVSPSEDDILAKTKQYVDDDIENGTW
ncbi:hypothetical protein FOL88_06055 [Lactobacillus reuteri]|uniref:hypothetical protein n=1 Tax=Limosilactobacillus reuteri TaxID=1598 RepID=UPI00146B149E|nr:hypothetical protein [Limosilactobacillus reuteri]NMV54476.1 hypothetical protein [Limosilactobacillus reuteri]NMV58386.1 hypothetical protein [Limosilactobacillus reuteri]